MKCYPLHMRQIHQRRRSAFFILSGFADDATDKLQPVPGQAAHFRPEPSGTDRRNDDEPEDDDGRD
ncbi:hypothetical protein [Pusillimonas minor]|uniref:Uncharacterized protein n=1 Tax=Pusillimonas minor TaxID=2697024 RepID=A0A842HJ53_9BURK|nr:hypothetical protein [Pusillimonas minor]MBC2768357.1 hypothetical protein [Pusillimonas minor]